MLKVTVEHAGSVVILHCVGRIVRGDENALLCRAVQQRSREVLLDLSAVEAIDAAGVGALIALQAAGVYLKLLNPSKAVVEVLRVTQLDSVFEICGTAGGATALKAGAAGDDSAVVASSIRAN